MLVEVEVYTVPHFKATINAKVEPEGLECDDIFISYLARPNLGHLLHKMGFEIKSSYFATAIEIRLRYEYLLYNPDG